MTNIRDKLAVVIVNWNSGDQLQNCLKSLRGQFPAVVVDNASTDNSCDGIEKLNNVRLIKADDNLGFGAACNLGARYTHSDYILFLNPDAAVFPGTIENTLSVMSSPENSRIGICGVQLIDESGNVARSCARFPSPWTFFCRTIGLDRVDRRLGLLMTDWAHDSTRYVDHVIGAFYLVRKSLFDRLGGFDERFFLYLEDLDFSERAKQEGWESLYLADIQAFHKGGGSSNQIKARRLFYILRSRILYADKHFSRLGSWAVIATTFLLEPISRSGLALGRLSWSELKETWQGYAMLWRWFPAWISKGVTR